jgi:hypothetical protein
MFMFEIHIILKIKKQGKGKMKKKEIRKTRKEPPKSGRMC